MNTSKPLFLTRTVLTRAAMVGIAAFYPPAYSFIKENVDAYFLLDLIVTIGLRYITKDEARFL